MVTVPRASLQKSPAHPDLADATGAQTPMLPDQPHGNQPATTIQGAHA